MRGAWRVARPGPRGPRACAAHQPRGGLRGPDPKRTLLPRGGLCAAAGCAAGARSGRQEQNRHAARAANERREKTDAPATQSAFLDGAVLQPAR